MQSYLKCRAMCYTEISKGGKHAAAIAEGHVIDARLLRELSQIAFIVIKVLPPIDGSLYNS